MLNLYFHSVIDSYSLTFVTAREKGMFMISCRHAFWKQINNKLQCLLMVSRQESEYCNDEGVAMHNPSLRSNDVDCVLIMSFIFFWLTSVSGTSCGDCGFCDVWLLKRIPESCVELYAERSRLVGNQDEQHCLHGHGLLLVEREHRKNEHLCL